MIRSIVLAALSLSPQPRGLLTLAPGQDTPFREVGEVVLPGVVTQCGERDKQWILEVDGGGLAAGDFDADGRHDLVVVDGSTVERAVAGEPGRPPRLFLQDEAGVLAAAPEEWSMKGGRFGMGVAAADVEGDGDLDLLVTQWGTDRLFLNEGNAGFEEDPAKSGLVGDAWGTSAAFFDLERDGDLDLAVVNYLLFDPAVIEPRASGACTWKGHSVLCGPEGLTPQHDQLYRNDGTGVFEEASAAVRFVPHAAAFGLGVTTLDFDLDGDTDLYVTNDSTPNHLWSNRGDGTVEEVGLRRGVAFDANGKEQAGMGIAVGDVDGNGREDLFCTNFSGESNALYLSGQRGRFRERAAPTGLGGPSVPLLGWGAAALDVDLDSDLDLVVVNGHVYPQAAEAGTDTAYAQPDYLYRMGAAGRFEQVPLTSAAPSVSRALTWLDLGNDGSLDLVVLTLDGPVRVLANQYAAHGSHWLSVRLQDELSRNRAALGARVTVQIGQRTLVREIRTAGGFQAALAAEAHFGLGAASEAKLEVIWPDGEVTLRESVPVDRPLLLRRTKEGVR